MTGNTEVYKMDKMVDHVRESKGGGAVILQSRRARARVCEIKKGESKCPCLSIKHKPRGLAEAFERKQLSTH